jgi:hypothetical protein
LAHFFADFVLNNTHSKLRKKIPERKFFVAPQNKLAKKIYLQPPPQPLQALLQTHIKNAAAAGAVVRRCVALRP